MEKFFVIVVVSGLNSCNAGDRLTTVYPMESREVCIATMEEWAKLPFVTSAECKIRSTKKEKN